MSNQHNHNSAARKFTSQRKPRALSAAGKRRMLALAAASALGLSVGTLAMPAGVRAASYTWQGTTSDWNTAANWSPSGGPPTTADSATFPTSLGATGVTFSSNGAAGSIYFSGSTAYTIGATNDGHTLTMSNSGGNSGTTAADTVSQTINESLVFSGSASYLGMVNDSSTTGVTLTIGGSVTGSATTGHTDKLEIGGSQNGTISGIISDGGAGGNVELEYGGTSTAVWTLAGVNTYTGTTTITGGTLALSPTGTVYLSSGVVVDSGTTFDVSQTTGGTSNVNDLSGTGTVALGAREMDVHVNSGSDTFGGVIQDGGIGGGSGGILAKQGAGTLILTGNNTYTGGTGIFAGTVSVSSDSNLGASTAVVDLIGGGTLEYTGSGGTISNLISVVGSGATNVLENSGSGTETLTGGISSITTGNILAFSGGIFNLNENNSASFTAGAIEIGDAPSTVIVSNANAFGSGDVLLTTGSTLETSGAELGSGSTLAVNAASYTQQAGSTLKLLATGSTVYDSLQLGGGAASLAGELNLIFSGFTPQVGQKYVVIGTTGTVSGNFSSIVLTGVPLNTHGVATFDPGVGEEIYIGYFTLLGLTPNQAAVAAYLNTNAESPTTPPAIVDALNSISGMSTSQQGAYLNLLTPQAYAQLQDQSIQNQTFMAQQVFGLMQDAFQGGGFNTSGLSILKTGNQNPFVIALDAAMQSAQQQANNSAGYLDDLGRPGFGPAVPEQENTPNNLSGFVLGTITVDQLSRNDIVPDQHFATGGMMAGLDYRLNRHWLVGALFNWGYTGGTLDSSGSRQRSNSYTPGVFVGYKQDGFYADGLMTYTYNSYHIDRQVVMPSSTTTATGEPDSNEYDANILGGYNLPLMPGLQAGPAAGAGFTQINTSGFSESGSPFDLTVAKQHADSLRSLLGMQAQYAVAPEISPMPISINFNAFWQHEFLDSARDLTASFTQLGGGSFIFNTAGPARNSALLGLGVNGYIVPQVSLFVNYETQVGDHNQFAQTAMGGVAVSF